MDNNTPDNEVENAEESKQVFGESLSNKFIRVKADDPSRCQATHAQYQCPYRAVGTLNQSSQTWDGPKYCPRHGGNKGIKKAEAESLISYRVAQWKDSIGHHTNSPKIKSLRQEIGVTRMLVEARLNQCKDETELLMSSHSVSEMMARMSDLVKTCHKIEKDTGQLLDKTQAQQWVNEIIIIISMYVTDPDVLQAMSEDMIKEFDKLLNQNANTA